MVDALFNDFWISPSDFGFFLRSERVADEFEVLYAGLFFSISRRDKGNRIHSVVSSRGRRDRRGEDGIGIGDVSLEGPVTGGIWNVVGNTINSSDNYSSSDGGGVVVGGILAGGTLVGERVADEFQVLCAGLFFSTSRLTKKMILCPQFFYLVCVFVSRISHCREGQRGCGVFEDPSSMPTYRNMIRDRRHAPSRRRLYYTTRN